MTHTHRHSFSFEIQYCSINHQYSLILKITQKLSKYLILSIKWFELLLKKWTFLILCARMRQRIGLCVSLLPNTASALETNRFQYFLFFLELRKFDLNGCFRFIWKTFQCVFHLRRLNQTIRTHTQIGTNAFEENLKSFWI